MIDDDDVQYEDSPLADFDEDTGVDGQIAGVDVDDGHTGVG